MSSNIVPFSIVKCEERKSLPTVSKFSPQNCVFYRIKIMRNCVKTTNQNWVPCKTETTRRAFLSVKQDRWRKGLIEEVSSCYSFFLYVSLGNLNRNKPWILLQNWTMRIRRERTSMVLRLFSLVLEQFQ